MGFNFKSKPAKPVRGGNGHMVGKQTSGPSRPNSMVNKGGGGKQLKGGKTKMVGFSGSKPAKPV
jgi:hypothetical protein